MNIVDRIVNIDSLTGGRPFPTINKHKAKVHVHPKMAFIFDLIKTGIDRKSRTPVSTDILFQLHTHIDL